jgi:quinoprotein glucose dehydrogenase
VLEKFRQLRAGAIFTLPSLQGTIILPGFHGGATRSGASFDLTTGLLQVSANNLHWEMTLLLNRAEQQILRLCQTNVCSSE